MGDLVDLSPCRSSEGAAPPSRSSTDIGFDDADIDVALARKMQAAVLDVGRDLLAIKSEVEYGQFVAWVERECRMNIRSAQRAMAAAALVEKNDKLSYLPHAALVQLAAPSTPAPVVQDIMDRIAAGARPRGSDIVAQIADAKERERDLARQIYRGGRRGPLTPEERARAEKTRARAEKTRERDERRRRREEAEREAEQAKQRAAQQAIAELLVNSLGDQLDALLNLAENAGLYWWQTIECQLQSASADRSAA
jgi:hypothetical protein